MKEKTIAILESRMHVITLPAWSASMEARHFLIFQTGVGTRALFAATDTLGLTDVLLRLLESAQVVVRGPKPATVLHSRKVRVDCAARDPFTTHEVLAAMHETPLRGKRVVVQYLT